MPLTRKMGNFPKPSDFEHYFFLQVVGAVFSEERGAPTARDREGNGQRLNRSLHKAPQSKLRDASTQLSTPQKCRHARFPLSIHFSCVFNPPANLGKKNMKLKLTTLSSFTIRVPCQFNPSPTLQKHNFLILSIFCFSLRTHSLSAFSH